MFPASELLQDKARFNGAPRTQVTFGDVAGIEGAKLELTEVVDFPQETPNRFRCLGPKNSAKVCCCRSSRHRQNSALAKAVAGEAGFPFLLDFRFHEFVKCSFRWSAPAASVISSSRPRKNGSLIVFIDEIDAVVPHSAAWSSRGGKRRAGATLDNSLTEMDGFEVANTTSQRHHHRAAQTVPMCSLGPVLRPGRSNLPSGVDRPD